MTPRLTAETFCFAPAQTFASPSRVSVRWWMAVDSTIELVCTGVAHKAPEQPSLASVGGAGGMAAGAAFAPPRAADARVRPIFSTLT